MMMSVGGVDFPNSVIDLERRIAVLELVIDCISSGKPLLPDSIENFNAQAVSDLQKNYHQLVIPSK